LPALPFVNGPGFLKAEILLHLLYRQPSQLSQPQNIFPRFFTVNHRKVHHPSTPSFTYSFFARKLIIAQQTKKARIIFRKLAEPEVPFPFSHRHGILTPKKEKERI